MRRRKDGRLEWRFYVKTPTGSVQMSAYGKSIADLEQDRERIEQIYEFSPKKITLDQLLARYIASKWADRSIDRRKICDMQSRFERLVSDEIGRMTIGKLCANWAILGDYFEALVQEYPNSYVVQRLFDELSRVFKFGRARQWCTINPMANLERPKYRPTKRRKAFTLEQVLDLLLKSSGRDRVMIAFLVMTALRTWSELSGLRVRDLNLLKKTVKLSTFVHRTENGQPVEKAEIPGKPRGKNEAAEREVPLVDPLIALLEEYLTVTGLGPDHYLFPNTCGGLLRANNWSRDVWKPLVKAIGRPDAVPYELRHTTNSLLAELGVAAEQRAEICGHSEKVNKYIYTHIGLEAKRSTMSKLGALFPALGSDFKQSRSNGTEGAA